MYIIKLKSIFEFAIFFVNNLNFFRLSISFQNCQQHKKKDILLITIFIFNINE